MTCSKDELIYVDKQVFVAGVDTFLLKIRKPFVMTLRLRDIDCQTKLKLKEVNESVINRFTVLWTKR